MLVIGSRNSSNSLRLVEVARDLGAHAHLIDNASELDESWLEGVRTVGISSGASAPESLVQELVALFRERGVSDVSEVEVTREDVRFMLPKTIRAAAPARVACARWSSRTCTWGRVRGSMCCAARRCSTRSLDALDGVDRLVLLGDTLELRQRGVAEVLASAEPVLRRDRRAARRAPGRCSSPATTTTR